MFRWILTQLVLAITATALALPVAILVLIVPAWGNLGMVAGKAWGRVMLQFVGARVRFHGRRPSTGDAPRVFISNHMSIVDIWVLAMGMPPETRFVAKRELFRIPIFGWAMAASGFISIDRQNRSAAIRSLERAAAKIRDGRPIVLFPEGTRSRDGRLAPFKKGAFHLALAAGVPVVPIAIRGSFDVMPPGCARVRPGDVDVFFEPELDLGRFRPDDHIGLLNEVRGIIARRLEGETAPAARVG